MRFLATTCLTCAVLLICCLLELSLLARNIAENDTPSADVALKWAREKPIALSLSIYLGFLLVSLVALLFYHLRLISLGETTNERVKGVWDGKQNPHDQGSNILYTKNSKRLPAELRASLLGKDAAKQFAPLAPNRKEARGPNPARGCRRPQIRVLTARMQPLH